MIRIAGVTVDGQKQIRFALPIIKGVGKSNVKNILAELKLDPTIKLDSLSETEVATIRSYIENNLIIEADLRRQNLTNIKRLIDIGTWRGKRHKVHLPVRGQRTKTNSRTARGNTRNTAGSGKVKAQKT